MSWLSKAYEKVKKSFGKKDAESAKEKCPKKDTGLLVVVLRKENRKPIEKAAVLIKGKTGSSKRTDKDGIAFFKPVEPDAYEIDVTLPRDMSEDYEKPEAGKQTVGEGSCPIKVVHAKPLAALDVEVVAEHGTDRAKKLDGVTVRLEKTDGKEPKDEETDKDGLAAFRKLKSEGYRISIKDLGKYKDSYDEKAETTVHVDAKPGKTQKKVLPVNPLHVRVYLKALFKDPEKKVREFPKGFALKFRLEKGKPLDAKVGEKGVVSVDVPRTAEGFTLDLTQSSVQYLALTKKKKIELVAKAKAAEKYKAGDRLFMFPTKTWNLKNSDWKVDNIPAYKKSEHKFSGLMNRNTEVGSEKKPVKLTLDPHWQFIRFEFFDRYFGYSDHGGKPISIPPIMLKGVRKSPDGKSTDYDAISSWTIGDDKKKLLQCLPWIISRKDDGSAKLPDLDKDMLLEFGEDKHYIVSKSAAKREIKKLESNADPLKLGPDRPKCYDLPKQWKSKNQCTRLSGDKKKFFDELTADDIKAAFDKSKPLGFSLDDIVLIKGNSQNIQDKDKNGGTKDLSEHSRLSLLYLDHKDTFKVKIHNPRDKAPYYSKTEFVKDGANKYRNVIVGGDPWTRAVIFCSGFYDIYNKRTETADFAKKEVLGARAAKLEDADISCHARITADPKIYGDYAAGNCGNFSFHFLQCGGVDTDQKRLMFALVTYWHCRLQKAADARGTGIAAAHVKKFVEEGMKNSMDRWNGKDYEFHIKDRNDMRGKFFAFFEAKIDEAGGKHTCMADVVKDNADGGSWMALNSAQFEKSTYDIQAGYYTGNPPGEQPDYDGTTYQCLTLSHELGHATGLDDEYAYSLSGYAGLYRYKQYYDGMPYIIDEHSVMYHCEAPRLRHCWGRVSWINNNIGSMPGIKNEDKHKIEMVYPGKNLHYIRTAGETLKDVYTPAHSEKNFDWGNSAKGALFLYALGDDEFARNLKNGPYNGIVVVNTKIAVRFKEGGIGAWASGKNYKNGDLVKESGKEYACTADHTSSAAFNTDKASKWTEVADKGEWAEATVYAVGEVVIESGAYYYCKTAHTSAGRTTDAAKWLEADVKGAWVTGKQYHVCDLVLQGGEKYLCKTAHTSGTFNTEKGNWIQVNDRGAWMPETEYAVTDVATHGGKTYYCNDEHTSAGRKNHDANWIQVDKRASSWTRTNKKDWLGHLNKAIVAMLEGPSGKFRFQCNADNGFKETYLRIFPQYEVVDSGDPAGSGTHFELEIKKDGTENFDTTTATKPKVGSNCKPKKIVRYFYGAANDVETDLTEGDLTKLKDWLQNKAGGTYSVKDIT